MTLLIGYESALEFWRSINYEFEITGPMLRNSEKAVQRFFKGGKQKISSISASQTAHQLNLATPLTVVSNTDSRRRNTPAFQIHAHAKMPPHSFINVDYILNQHPYHRPQATMNERSFVALPEACFLQLASTLDLEDLIQLGFELCGTYSIRDDYVAYQQFQHLTTTDKLNKYINTADQIPGVKKARKALKFICDNSASPMETALTMLLCLPYSKGGFGFQKPLLNYRINLDLTLRRATNKSYFVCDLFWPNKQLAIEYDSDQFHSESSKRVKDIDRKNILLGMGVNVITITTPQILNRAYFNQSAKAAAKSLGKQLRYKEPLFSYRQSALREQLFNQITAWHHF